jgi:hypothetical protein
MTVAKTAPKGVYRTSVRKGEVPMSLVGPIRSTWALQQVVSYLRDCGHDGNILREATPDRHAFERTGYS